MATVSPNPQLPARPEGFDQEVRELVDATAPQLFAVNEEFSTEGGMLDACVAAWGLAHEDGTAMVATVDARQHLSLRSAERALRWFSRGDDTRAYLVWVEPTQS